MQKERCLKSSKFKVPHELDFSMEDCYNSVPFQSIMRKDSMSNLGKKSVSWAECN